MSRDTLLSLIEPNPDQPRKCIDQAKIEELACSMAENGLIQPVMVRPTGDCFMIVHGERRYRAALSLGWETIPAEVRDIPADEAQWLALVENIQRADLSPTEEARAYRERLAKGVTQGALAERVGKSRSYIAQKVRLLKLPGEVQAAIGADEIKEGHARQLLRIQDTHQQSTLCKRAVVESWTVERMRLEVDLALKPAPRALPSTPAELARCLHELNQGEGKPNHDPYPEERLPDSFDPPVEVRRLPIAEIVDEPHIDPRLDRDPTWAAWLAEIFDILPAIAVFRIAGQYILSDGRYRLMAARLLGLREIDCRIYEGNTISDADRYAAAANSAGGIPLAERDHKHILAHKNIMEVLTEGLQQLRADYDNAETLPEFVQVADAARKVNNVAKEWQLRNERALGKWLARAELTSPEADG